MQVQQTEMDGAGLVVIAEDDESRSKSFFFFSLSLFIMWSAVLGPAFLCSGCLEGIWRRSLKDTEMLLLFVYLKTLVSSWLGEQMKVMGEEREKQLKTRPKG